MLVLARDDYLGAKVFFPCDAVNKRGTFHMIRHMSSYDTVKDKLITCELDSHACIGTKLPHKLLKWARGSWILTILQFQTAQWMVCLLTESIELIISNHEVPRCDLMSLWAQLIIWILCWKALDARRREKITLPQPSHTIHALEMNSNFNA